MGTPWKLYLCLEALLQACFGARVFELDEHDAHLAASSATQSAVLTLPASLTLIDLPPELLHTIGENLTPKDFYAFKFSCKTFYHFLSHSGFVQRQLQLWGVLIEYRGGVLTEESTVILAASPLISKLWREKDCSALFKKRLQIIEELMGSALKETDLFRQEIILRQAITLGDREAADSWKAVIFSLPRETSLKCLLSAFSRGSQWGAKLVVDDILGSFIEVQESCPSDLFDLHEESDFLKHFCILGAFQAIRLIADKIRIGESGFTKDEVLSEKLTLFLSQNSLESEWSVVKPKKSRKYIKITLQDLLLEIMSAIDARKYK